MINVALEISTIGLGESEKESGKDRTGLYRVNTELTKALFEIPGVRYHLFFWAYPYISKFGIQYFEKRGLIVKQILSNSPLEEFVYHQLFKSNNFPLKHTVMRMSSRIFKLFKYPSLPKYIDIYHSFYYPLPGFINPKHKIRFLTIHDLTPLILPKMFPESHRRKFIRGISKISPEHDWFFAISNNTKNDLCRLLNIAEERVFITSLAACRKTFYPIKDKTQIESVKKILNIPDKPYFFSLATLEPRKNLRLTISAFKKFLQDSNNHHDMNLLLVGRRGWFINSLLSDINSNPALKGKIILTGFVPDYMLAPLLSGAVAFVYPSLYEGFGLPVLEAMQCGAPVITSNTSSLPEVVGDAAIMIDAKKEVDLVEAFFNIASDENLRTNLSEKSIERSKHFSWEKSAEETVKAYRIALINSKD
jgi:glycosyltransferase involved in cell wall biosynthesis